MAAPGVTSVRGSSIGGSLARRRRWRPGCAIIGPVKVLADKAVLLAGGSLVLAGVATGATASASVSATAPGPLAVSCLLLAVVLSAVASAWETRAWAAPIPLVTLLIAALSPLGLSGAPLAAYDVVRRLRLSTGHGEGATSTAPEQSPVDSPLASLDAVVAVGAALLSASTLRWAGQELALTGVLACAASLLAVRSADEQRQRARLLAAHDDLRAKIRFLRASRAELVEAQEYQARAATLAERTRIAHDMHDTVGHQLTRLLFQVRALQTVHAGEPQMTGALDGLGSGLEESLSAMRASVHALSDDGVDLAVALHTLAASSPVPRVNVDCEVEAPPPAPVSRCIVAVVREALTNAARHGQAASARVAVADFPGFWRVSVSNDGGASDRTGIDDGSDGEGMGLRSMRERLRALGGTLHVQPRPVFTVTATITKSGRSEP